MRIGTGTTLITAAALAAASSAAVLAVRDVRALEGVEQTPDDASIKGVPATP